jgi:CheY-like chemotaxis protein
MGTEVKAVRVLVVEDDPDIADAMKQMLEFEGYAVDTASHGLDALSKLRSGRAGADLILLDLRMPVMDGFAFREAQLHDAKLKEIPVVVVTADSRAAEASPSLHVDTILRSPVDPDRLLDVVKAFA